MNRELSGWKDIFSFTFIQGIKTKSTKILLFVLFVVGVAVIPIITAVKGNDTAKKGEFTIGKVYVDDYTGFGFAEGIQEYMKNAQFTEEEKRFENIVFTDKTKEVQDKFAQAMLDRYKDHEEELEELGNDKPDIDYSFVYSFENQKDAVYLDISAEEDSFSVHIVYDEDTKVKEGDAEDYLVFIENHFEDILFTVLGADKAVLEETKYTQNVVFGMDLIVDESEEPEQEESIGQESETETEEIIETAKETEDEDEFPDTYVFVYALAMIVMFMLSVGGELVAMGIVSEKSSKTIELLMTSARPLAIVFGKTVANLCMVFINLSAIVIGFALGTAATGYMVGDGSFVMPSALNGVFGFDALEGLNPVSVILAILLFIMGFFFYGMLAAFSGASVSRVQDAAEGMKGFIFVVMIGAYLAIFEISNASYIGGGIFKHVVGFLPISSPFIVPATLITGDWSIGFGLISLLLLTVLSAVMVKVVANVYENMMYYNGNPMKIKEMILLAKRGGNHDEEKKQ